MKIPPIDSWEDEIIFSDDQSAWVQLKTPEILLSLEVQVTVRKFGLIDATGASWSDRLGAYRLRLALQRYDARWRGVGSIRARQRHFQFEAVFEWAASKTRPTLSGSGTCRKRPVTVSCLIIPGQHLLAKIRRHPPSS